jgi:hypothetical protein
MFRLRTEGVVVDKIGPAVQVDTVAVRKLGSDLAHDVQPLLAKASRQLTDTRGILHTNFTSVTVPLAIAYAGAVEYFDPELRSKHDHLAGLEGTLDRVATNWEETERRSTAKVEG